MKYTAFNNVLKKHLAVKTQNNNNSRLINWIDFVSVRENFNYQGFGVIPLDCNSFLKTRLIQVAKLVSPSLVASVSNCCRNSSVNLIWYCGDLFSFCVDMVLTLDYYNYMVTTIIVVTTRKNNPPKCTTTVEGSNPTIKLEVMIMANRYDSAHLCARQSKLYKFYDLSTAQVVQTTATTERQARKNLGKQSLIFIARKPISPIFERSINWGGYSHV